MADTQTVEAVTKEYMKDMKALLFEMKDFVYVTYGVHQIANVDYFQMKAADIFRKHVANLENQLGEKS